MRVSAHILRRHKEYVTELTKAIRDAMRRLAHDSVTGVSSIDDLMTILEASLKKIPKELGGDEEEI